MDELENQQEIVRTYLKKTTAKGLCFDLLFTESYAHGTSEDSELAQAVASGLPIVNVASLSKSSWTKPPEKFSSKTLFH